MDPHYPWQALPGEPGRCYAWASEYFRLGHTRSLDRLAAMPEAPARRTLARWSERWEWSTRARAYDAHLVEQDQLQWETYRAETRAALYARRGLAVEVLEAVASGRVPIPACDCGAEHPEECRCGASVPMLDRHGELVGVRPAVAASPRLEAAKAILDRIGITAPKRVELTGADGSPLKIALQAHLGQLPVAALEALVNAFGDEPEEGADDGGSR